MKDTQTVQLQETPYLYITIYTDYTFTHTPHFTSDLRDNAIWFKNECFLKLLCFNRDKQVGDLRWAM